MKIIKNGVKPKKSGPGTFIFEFSVKLRFEWWYFRRIKPKPCPLGEKTVLEMTTCTCMPLGPPLPPPIMQTIWASPPKPPI